MAEVLNDVAKQAIDYGIEGSLNLIEEELRPSADQVKLAAKELVDYTNLLQNEYNSVLASSAQVQDYTEAINFSKKMVDSKEKFKKLMEKVLRFQNLSNAFLGQQVQMTFVAIAPKTGEVTLYALENSVDDLVLDRASKSHGGAITGRFQQSVAKRLGQQIINSKYEQSGGLNRLNDTFGEVWQRFNLSREKLKLRGAAYILWKVNGWDGAWVSGAGPLGEAYVNFFINEFIFSQGMEKNVRDFMLNSKYGAVLADNASGFLQGDVGKNGVEFGVKIGGASALSYMEIIGYAQEILETTDVKQYLLALKQKLAEKGSSNMVKPLNGILNEEVDSLVSELEQKMKS